MTSEELATLIESVGPEQIREWEVDADTVLSRAFREAFKNDGPRLKGVLGACAISAVDDNDLFTKILFIGWMMGWKTSEKIHEVGELEKLTEG